MTSHSTSLATVTEPADFRYTTFADVHASTLREFRGWQNLCLMLKDPPTLKSKSLCPLVKLATFGEVRTDKGSLRHNDNLKEVFGVEGDYDGGQVSVAEAVLRLEASGIECIVYSTPSHTAAAPRWRVLAPLAKGVQASERAAMLTRLNAALGRVLAPESFTPSQAYFFGRVSGAHYEFQHVRGAFIDELDLSDALAAYGGTGRPVVGPHQARAAEEDLDDGTAFERHTRLMERERAIEHFDEITLQDLVEALPHVSATEREVWIAVGQALASLKGTPWEAAVRDLWVSWSQTAPNHKPDTDPDTWGNLTGNRSDYRAVFAKAKAQGWDPGARARQGKSKSQSVAAKAGSAVQRNRGGGDGSSAVEVVLVQGSTLKPEPIQWLWEGWLARSKLHLLGGKPGQGKTTIALALAATATSGGRWPDGSRAEATNVLIWSGEDDPADTLVPRLRVMGADMSRVFFIDGVLDGEKRPFDPAIDMGLLLDRVRQIGTVGLLIIDPVVSVVTGDSHHNAEVRRALQPVVNLGMALEAAVLGITHLAKGTKGHDPIERVIGSVAFSAVARVIMMAAKDMSGAAGPDGRILVRSKSNIGPDGDGFVYSLNQVEDQSHPGIRGSSVLWGGSVLGEARSLLQRAEGDQAQEPRAARTASDDAAAVIRWRLSNGEMDSQGIKDHLLEGGFTKKQVRRAYEKVTPMIRIEGFGKDRRSYWSLPPAELSATDAHGRPPLRGDGIGHHWAPDSSDSDDDEFEALLR